MDDVLYMPIREDVFERSDFNFFLNPEALALGKWCNDQTADGPCPLSRQTIDGARSETSVARVFYDLADDAQTANYAEEVDDDLFDLPWNWIGDIIATCEVQEASGWRRADGIDDLIYCFEGTLGEYHPEGFFPTRIAPPIAWRTQAGSAPANFGQRNFRYHWQNLLFPHGHP